MVILLIAAILLAAVFLAGRYGWKVFGFRACQGTGIESVEVNDIAVRIKGFYPGSFPEGFCGCYYEEQNGKLFVGFRFSAVFGMFESGQFDVTIPVKSEISEVILKTETDETRIWERENTYEPETEPKTEPESEPEARPESRPELEGFGVYVRLDRSDVSSIFLSCADFTDGMENADGSIMSPGEWYYMGDKIAIISNDSISAIPFTVGALASDGSKLIEGGFFYDAAQEKLYVTVAEDSVTCSTSDAPDAPADIPQILTLPILDEIDAIVTPGTAGSSLQAIRAAAMLLDWGVNTGLDTGEISEAASTWLAAKGGAQSDSLQKLSLVDEAYKKLLGNDARELMDAAGCEGMNISWGEDPVETIEAVMKTAGLRG